MKRVALLGATGSIGRSTLAVLQQHPDRFTLKAVTSNRNVSALADVVRRFRPELAVIADGAPPSSTTSGTIWRSGRQGVIDAATHPDVDIVVNALVGAAGLEPTIGALRAGKRVALANKESLVCGGPLVLQAEAEGGGELMPVDSEHSAVLQCVHGYGMSAVERIILTASGGPFRHWTAEALAGVTPADALRHPTWNMGNKVTIDSATLANKALEVIEAHFLFRLGYDRITSVVHPQSVIHAMVEFVDGSVLSQMGFPTMELPILFALGYPERLPYRPRRFDPLEAQSLTFEPIREEAFPAYTIGVGAGRAGGAYPAIFSAANEVAVAGFLRETLTFDAIPQAIDATMQRWAGTTPADVDSVLAVDQWARQVTETFIKTKQRC